ncbi:MAG: conjugal transfer protein TraF, partial [Thiohalomonadales bacterium]
KAKVAKEKSEDKEAPESNISVIAQLRVLAAGVNYEGATSNTDDVNIDLSRITQADNPIGITINNNDSTLLTRAAAISELSLGYSTQVNFGSSENFSVGVRGKYYRVGLAQINQRLSGVIEGSEQIFDALKDADYTDSEDFGLDIGIIWSKANYQLGASIENINEPSFEYNLLDLTNYNPNGRVARRLNRVIDYTMETLFKFEGSLYTDNQAIAWNTSLDGNGISDPFGDQYQWFSTNLSFNINSWIIPDVRVGYRANLVGTELTYATFGLSLFKAILTLDVAYGLEEVVLDGTAVPRSFAANIGIQASF